MQVTFIKFIKNRRLKKKMILKAQKLG